MLALCPYCTQHRARLPVQISAFLISEDRDGLLKCVGLRVLRPVILKCLLLTRDRDIGIKLNHIQVLLADLKFQV
jgi:hypothetical protein